MNCESCWNNKICMYKDEFLKLLKNIEVINKPMVANVNVSCQFYKNNVTPRSPYDSAIGQQITCK